MSYKNCESTLLSPLIERAKSFLTEDIGIEVLEESNDQKCDNSILSFAYTSMIPLSGGVDGLFLMSFERTLLEEVTDRFVYGGVDESEKDEIISSLSDEVTNIILGNVLGSLIVDGFETETKPPVKVIDIDEVLSISKKETISLNINSTYGKMLVVISADNVTY